MAGDGCEQLGELMSIDVKNAMTLEEQRTISPPPIISYELRPRKPSLACYLDMIVFRWCVGDRRALEIVVSTTSEPSECCGDFRALTSIRKDLRTSFNVAYV